MPATYIAGKALTLTINSQVIKAQVATADDEIGEVDVTNLTSGGEFELIVDIKMTSISGTAVMDSSSLQSFTNGTQVAASYTVASGHAYSGTFVVLRQSHKAGVKGAYTVDFSGKFTGTVTRS